jgi:hypothetical protein
MLRAACSAPSTFIAELERSAKMKTLYLENDADVRFVALLRQKSLVAYDVVLTDGSYIMNVLGHHDELFGVAVGGHTGFIYFRDISLVAGHKINEVYRVTGIYGLPFIGRFLRNIRIVKSGAHPAFWLPKM